MILLQEQAERVLLTYTCLFVKWSCIFDNMYPSFSSDTTVCTQSHFQCSSLDKPHGLALVHYWKSYCCSVALDTGDAISQTFTSLSPH